MPADPSRLPPPPPILLAGIRALVLENDPLPGATHPTPWEELRGFVDSQRCWPLATVALSRVGWPYDEGARSYAEEQAAGALGQCVILDREAISTAAVLTERELPFALTKGAAFANLLWPDPGWRTYSDLDLVVARSRLPEVVTALLEAGAQRHGADPDLPAIARYAKGVMYATPRRVEVDLHMNLCDGPYTFTIDETALLDDAGTLGLAGAPVPVLSLERLFLHACLHAALPSDARRLIPLTDVAMGTARAGIDAHRVQELASAWRLEAVVADAVGEAEYRFGLPATLPLVAWSGNRRRRLRDRRWLAAYRSHGRWHQVLMTTAKLEAQPNWAARRRYSNALLQGSDLGIRERLRRALARR